MEFDELFNLYKEINRNARETKISMKAEGIEEIPLEIDFSPEEYTTYEYENALQSYERIGKIKKMGEVVFPVKPKPSIPQVVVKPKDMETEKKVETEVMKKEEEEEMVFEKLVEEEIERKPEIKEKREIIERIKKIEIEKEKIEHVEPTPREIISEKKEVVTEKGIIISPLFTGDPQQAGKDRMEEIQKRVNVEIDETGEVDKENIRMKMLELTRELFKEKDGKRKKEIKLEIVALKHLIEKGTKKVEDPLLNAILNDQYFELTSVKNSINDMFEKRINIILLDAEDKRKTATKEEAEHIYKAFVEEISLLGREFISLIDETCKFLTKKHLAELDYAMAYLKKQQVKLAEEAKEKLKREYDEEFSSLKEAFIKDMDQVTHRELFYFFPEKVEEENIAKAIVEISSLGESNLLFYLERHASTIYESFKKGEISKSEAILKAKQVIASKKGLDPRIIKKYFGG